MSLALRSTIFFSAIWRTWAELMLPTISRRGSELPFSTPAALRIKSEAGGVRTSNENERSS